MAKKGSPKTDQGKIQKAGMLLSQFVREIALEKTQLEKNIDGEDKMVSKAEALARLIWKRALGYIEIRINDDGTKTEIIHLPDRVYVAMIFDRMEGRAPLMNPEKGDKRSIADKVSEQGKKRSNKIAEGSIK